MAHAFLKRATPIALAGALACAPVPPALAQSHGVTPPTVYQPSLDLNALRSIQRQQQFQERQRRERAEDRRDNMRRPAQPDVPVIRPTCSPATTGPCR